MGTVVPNSTPERTVAKSPVLGADFFSLSMGVALRSAFRVWGTIQEERIEIQLGLSLGGTLILASI